MIGTTGCTIINKDKNEVPEHPAISEEYSNIDDYRKYVIQNGNATKLYNSQNIYLLFNKETYEITECIYNKKDVLGGLFCAVEVYDLSSEKLLVYSDGINHMRNQTYYEYLIENKYQVYLANTSDYIEGYNNKELDVSDYIISKNRNSVSNNHKQKQLDIVKNNNPVIDDYHTWIRNVGRCLL